MKCPHCLEHFTADWEYNLIGVDHEGQWGSKSCICDNVECKRVIIELVWAPRSFSFPSAIRKFWLVRPKGIARTALSTEVPSNFTEEYQEACRVFSESAKASAALSRRCLQNLLREKAGTQSRDLADQIQEVLDSRALPSDLANDLDAVRNIGNFASHPIKSKSTGEIVDVEPGEAEWNLDVLEELFDYYFVRPTIRQKKRSDLNQKLADVGKPPMKSASA